MLSPRKSETVITLGPLSNVRRATPVCCSHAITHTVSLCHRGEDRQALRYRTAYQVRECQNTVVLSQEVGTKHATTEGQQDSREGLVIFGLDLGARKGHQENSTPISQADSGSQVKRSFLRVVVFLLLLIGGRKGLFFILRVTEVCSLVRSLPQRFRCLINVPATAGLVGLPGEGGETQQRLNQHPDFPPASIRALTGHLPRRFLTVAYNSKEQASTPSL